MAQREDDALARVVSAMKSEYGVVFSAPARCERNSPVYIAARAGAPPPVAEDVMLAYDAYLKYAALEQKEEEYLAERRRKKENGARRRIKKDDEHAGEPADERGFE